MAETYKIILSKRFAADLEKIFDFIAERSPQNAPVIIDRFLKSMESLKTFPHRTVAELAPANPKSPVRSLPVQKYVIFFRVMEDQKVVRMLRVRHGARRRLKRYE